MSLVSLFRALFRVGHDVVSSDTLRGRDIKLYKWRALVSVNSSKKKQRFSVHKISIARAESNILFQCIGWRGYLLDFQ